MHKILFVGLGIEHWSANLLISLSRPHCFGRFNGSHTLHSQAGNHRQWRHQHVCPASKQSVPRPDLLKARDLMFKLLSRWEQKFKLHSVACLSVMRGSCQPNMWSLPSGFPLDQKCCHVKIHFASCKLILLLRLVDKGCSIGRRKHVCPLLVPPRKSSTLACNRSWGMKV